MGGFMQVDNVQPSKPNPNKNESPLEKVDISVKNTLMGLHCIKAVTIL
jgi:hypothetical protein